MFYGKPMPFFKQIGMCYETILEQGPSVPAGGVHRPWLTEESPKAEPGFTF